MMDDNTSCFTHTKSCSWGVLFCKSKQRSMIQLYCIYVICMYIYILHVYVTGRILIGLIYLLICGLPFIRTNLHLEALPRSFALVKRSNLLLKALPLPMTCIIHGFSLPLYIYPTMLMYREQECNRSIIHLPIFTTLHGNC